MKRNNGQLKTNKHEYRAVVSELKAEIGDTQNGGQTSDRQTDKQTKTQTDMGLYRVARQLINLAKADPGCG